MDKHSDLGVMRHSLAHLLAAAVLELWPEAKPTVGPAIDTGFYYDFDLPTPLSDKDLPKIETQMRKILPSWTAFTRKEVTEKESRKLFKKNPYKLELIDDIIKSGEKITLYTSGDFTDLCRGGHVENPAKDINPESFKLERVAGAYWRGDEKNKMLTRIYGLAFGSKKELDDFIAQREEAKKRDHKKLGKELGLFVFSELVGPGLPLWTPKGTIIRELLNDYVWQLRKEKGYMKVAIPHITKKGLYEISGHWTKFANELFKITTRENHLFAMKPMNCPHHTQIFASSPKSYRDMPQRYCETTMVYRDEQSGELSGLSRVLSITQDDAHVFCRKNQIEEEVFAVWDIIDKFYGAFGFELSVRFSKHDDKHFEKYIGTPEIWKSSEEQLQSLIEKRGVEWVDGAGEAALYGPKIDFMTKDSIGRTLQIATIQLDFNTPKSFDLVCVNEKGEREQVVMIHAAIMGSIERFMGTLIEHYAGAFPVWLSPVQIKILPVSENQFTLGKEILNEFKKHDIRAELDLDNEGLGKKVRNAKVEKVPYFIVVGEKEAQSKRFNLEKREGEKTEGLEIENVVGKLLEEIISKK